jgi:hypothetical protein
MESRRGCRLTGLLTSPEPWPIKFANDKTEQSQAFAPRRPLKKRLERFVQNDLSLRSKPLIRLLAIS